MADCTADGSGTRLLVPLREAVLRAAVFRRAVLDFRAVFDLVGGDRLASVRLGEARLAEDLARADGLLPPDALVDERFGADFFPVTRFAT